MNTDPEFGDLESRLTARADPLPPALHAAMQTASWRLIYGVGDYRGLIVGVVSERAVEGLTVDGHAGAVITPWLFRGGDFLVELIPYGAVQCRVLRNRANGALLFGNRIAAAAAVQHMWLLMRGNEA